MHNMLPVLLNRAVIAQYVHKRTFTLLPSSYKAVAACGHGRVNKLNCERALFTSLSAQPLVNN